MVDQVMFSSKTDDWATPQDFFDDLDQEFGFTLEVWGGKEPCSVPINDRYFWR